MVHVVTFSTMHLLFVVRVIVEENCRYDYLEWVIDGITFTTDVFSFIIVILVDRVARMRLMFI